MLDLEKDDLNIAGEHCGFLTYPHSTFLSNLTTILKTALLIPYICSWFWRKQNRTCPKRTVFLFWCVWELLKGWCAFALSNSELSQHRKEAQRGYFSNTLQILLKSKRTSHCYFHWIIIKCYYLHNFSFPQVSSFPINLQYYRNWQRIPENGHLATWANKMDFISFSLYGYLRQNITIGVNCRHTESLGIKPRERYIEE